MAYIELAKFKLRTGVSDEAFLQAERNIRNGRIRQQPGYLGREIGRGENDEWFIIIRWESAAAGEAWSPIFMQDPHGQAFASHLDFSSMRQEHFTVVSA